MSEQDETARVLVVDDDAVNRDLLTRRLVRAGYQTTEAASGIDALNLLKFEHIDMVLLDINMPGLSGLQVLKRIRSQWSVTQLPVVMVTARDENLDLVQSMEHGANDYVTKPINFKVLLARIRTQFKLKQMSDLRDEFLRIAAHDLKNPLARVVGYLSLVEARHPVGTPMTEKGVAMMAATARAARQMNELIIDFLEVHRVDGSHIALKPQQIDLAGLVREALEALSTQADYKSIQLELECAPDLRTAYVDPRRIEQVIENLLGNAIKFSPKSTVLTVRLLEAGERLRCEISDQGPGLSEDDLNQVFHAYTTLSAVPTGGESSSGLGLHIAKNLILAHKGEIGVLNNAPPPGATFWFEVP